MFWWFMDPIEHFFNWVMGLVFNGDRRGGKPLKDEQLAQRERERREYWGNS